MRLFLCKGRPSASETFFEASAAGDKVSGWVSGQREGGSGAVISSVQQERSFLFFNFCCLCIYECAK